MSYDSDENSGYGPKRQNIPTANPRDLDVIVTLLELAALELTPERGATFTREELFHEARAYGGEELVLLETDLNIVLGMGGIVQKVPGGRYRMKAL